MPKTLILSVAAIGAVLLGLLSGSSWGDAPPLCREGRVSESKACSVRMELLRSGELAEDGIGQQAAIESQRQPAGSLSSFTLESSELVGGRPLQGVRLALTAVWSHRNYMTTSGEDGFAKIEGVVPGIYFVETAHDSFAPCEPSYGRKRTVRIPGPIASCKWVEVYMIGWKAIGSKTPVPLDRVSFAPGPEYRQENEVSKRDLDRITLSLRGKWGDPIKVCVPRPGSSLSKTITIFDEEKGPCQFDVPMTPVSKFHTRTVCDISQMPVVKPMSRLTIEVVDSGGKPIDIGRISIQRDTPYFGYRSDRLLGNATHVIPAGTYEISTTGLSYPWKHLDKTLTLEAGESAVVKYRLPHRMREVMLVVPGKGAIARIQSGEAYGNSLSIGCRHRLWMPEGVTTLSFIYVPKMGEKSVLVHRDIKVASAEGLQHISVLLD